MFEFIISSSVLIIAIAVIRCLFRKKVDNRLIYAVWLLLVIKLVSPFPSYLLDRMDIRVFQIKTPLSIMNIVNNWTFNETTEKMTAGSYNTDSIQQASGGIQVDNNLHQKQNSGLNNSNTVPKKGIGQVPFHYFIYTIWLLGAALIFICQIVCSCRLRKILLLNREERNLFDQKVYVIKKLRTPLLVRGKGVQTDIYIPDSITDNRQLVFHAILHEKIHKKHGDIWWGYVRNILVAIYWFHPLVWMAAYLSKRDAEYACDSGVMEKMDYAARIAYGDSLLDLVEMNEKHLAFCTATTMGAGRSEMKRRIVMIKSETKKSVIAIMAVILLLAGMGAICFTRAEPPKEEVTQVSNDKNIGTVKADQTAVQSVLENYFTDLINTLLVDSSRDYTSEDFISVNGYIVAKEFVTQRENYKLDFKGGICAVELEEVTVENIVEMENRIAAITYMKYKYAWGDASKENTCETGSGYCVTLEQSGDSYRVVDIDDASVETLMAKSAIDMSTDNDTDVYQQVDAYFAQIQQNAKELSEEWKK